MLKIYFGFINTDVDMAFDSLNRLLLDEDVKGGFANRKATGKLPDPLPSPLFLNLGCGRDIREGFVNIDLFSDNPTVVSMDIRKLDIPDNSADAILASDVLEHFSHRETDNILAEWNRVLKPGGELIIRCPSLRLQMQAYQNGTWNADIASYMIFGGQTNPGDYHCVAFDEKSIRQHLSNAGLEVTFFEEEDTPQNQGYINLNMVVRARKTIVEIKPDFIDENKPEENISFAGFSFEEEVEEISQPSEEYEFNYELGEFDVDLFSEVAGFNFSSEETAQDEKVQSEPEKQLNIVWEGSQFVYHSLALINREHCSNIINTGVAEVSIVPYEPDTIDYTQNEKYRLLAEHDVRFKQETDESTAKLPYVWVRHQWPPKFEEPRGAMWIIMQPWEFSQLRKDFAELFARADEIWTPSNYSRQCFVDSGVDFDKVQVMPNGIDPQIFTPFGNKYPLKTNKKFKLLYVGGTIFRKGIDIVLNAYLEAFKAEDNVTLVIKDIGGQSFYKGQGLKDKILELSENPNVPEVIYIDEELTEQEIAALYRTCDLYISPYRGEGFSLPTLEAMACGLPVVVTAGGATDDFTDDAFAYYIPAGRRSIGNIIDGMPLTGEAFLLEPDQAALSSVLKKLYDSPTPLKSMGLIASLKARTDCTWKRATMKILTRLDFLCETTMARDAMYSLEERDDAAISLARAENYYLAGDFETSYGMFANLINMSLIPEEWLGFANLRLALMDIEYGNYETAEISMKEAESGGSVDLDYVKSIFYASQGKTVDALESLNEMMDKWRDVKFDSKFGFTLDELLTLAGDYLFEMDDLEASNQMYTLALGINPENPYACFGAGMVFKSVEANGEASEMFEWALKLKPDFSRALEALEELRN